MLLTDILREANYEVVAAPAGTQAIQLLDKVTRFDLIVTDLTLPGAHGVAVAVYARSKHPDVPLLFVTARGDLLASLNPPAPFRHLAKPFSLTEFSRAVANLLPVPGP